MHKHKENNTDRLILKTKQHNLTLQNNYFSATRVAADCGCGRTRIGWSPDHAVQNRFRADVSLQLARIVRTLSGRHAGRVGVPHSHPHPLLVSCARPPSPRHATAATYYCVIIRVLQYNYELYSGVAFVIQMRGNGWTDCNDFCIVMANIQSF